MKTAEYNRTIKTAKQPLMVEFWAPWCTPCKIMAPTLTDTSKAFDGKVRLIKINADESPELLQSLQVVSIPTFIGYREGQQVLRKVGAQTPSRLNELFSALAEGREVRSGLRLVERWIRGGLGIILTAVGVVSGPSYWLLLLAALIIFSAVYDRCPIYKAAVSRIKKLFARERA